jgi:hypothetical protein
MTVWAILGTVGLIVAFVAGGLWIDKRVSLLPRPEELAAGPALERQKRLAHAAGAAPETALTATAGELDKLVRRQRHCRARMEREPDDEVVYDGRTLTVMRFRCTTCGARDRIYVTRG